MKTESFEEWKTRTGNDPKICPTPQYTQPGRFHYRMRDLADPASEKRVQTKEIRRALGKSKGKR